jgi:GMP synthase (glutamine-hydrolysing)
MTQRHWIAILDFGSQYTQLIARRIRELGVYSEIVRYDLTAERLRARRPDGVILSGGPASVFDEQAPLPDPHIFELGVPVLGICYGLQAMARLLGGQVRPGRQREFGHARLTRSDESPLLAGLPGEMDVWMSHGDQVETLPPGFHSIARTITCPVAAMADEKRHLYGLQFHPEVVHTPHGREILRRFVFAVCGASADWNMGRFIEESVEALRERIGRGQVVCGLSGGVDSAVTAALIHRAVGSQLHCIFVDNGLLRAGEPEQVAETFGHTFGMDLHVVRAGNRFFHALRGVTDPEQKRKIIGRLFIEVFSEEARRLGRVEFLAQGTLYPDVIESLSPLGGPSATIKSHHNVGGLPPDLAFTLVEPIRELFKDEVRELGRRLGLPPRIVNRQPFPGPGFAVRVLGEVTPERVALLRQADQRVQEEIEKMENYSSLWQSFAVLLPVQTVGVMGDGRTYEYTIALRIVESQDGMTADWARVPYEVLARISNRIINEVRGVNRVVYDISSKPPATIEWE